MLDRTSAPAAGKIAFDGLPDATQKTLPSGTPLFWLRAGDQPVVKIEIVFQSGIWHEPKKAVSWLAAKMLAEGTRSKSSRDLMEAFDALGAFLEISPGFDDVNISVYGLKKNFDQVIGLLNEMINESNFPDHEFELMKSNRKDQITLNDNKSNLYASKKLREAIYGPKYPYGQGLSPDDIDAVELSEVKEYYEKHLFNKPKIYLCGEFDDSVIETLTTLLSIPLATASTKDTIALLSPVHDIVVERPDSLQSSIRVGWLVPNRLDKDYFHYQIANSLLGGYFGSRLMKNIREEKGYTYGIHAYPVHLRHSSFGMIATDVVAAHTQDTLNEIQFEINKLIEEPIAAEEINVLTNYLAGSFLSSINTPFELMSKFKKVQEIGLDSTYYQQYFECLRTINEEEIKRVMEKYFNMEKACSAVVGLNQ
ncbi:MAG: pitrilysin family protein [Reichenbachiella sp.]|uniref:M16 family metallopeptidase n=1 Tax=Reichenbachiella sp. TaxID=2184521 RepID=UPI0032666146